MQDCGKRRTRRVSTTRHRRWVEWLISSRIIGEQNQRHAGCWMLYRVTSSSLRNSTGPARRRSRYRDSPTKRRLRSCRLTARMKKSELTQFVREIASELRCRARTDELDPDELDDNETFESAVTTIAESDVRRTTSSRWRDRDELVTCIALAAVATTPQRRRSSRSGRGANSSARRAPRTRTSFARSS